MKNVTQDFPNVVHVSAQDLHLLGALIFVHSNLGWIGIERREKRKKGRRESVKCNRCYGEKGRDRKKMTWKWDERESGWMINFFLCCARGIGNGLVRY